MGLSVQSPSLRTVAGLLALVMLAGACGSGDTREVRAFLDARYERVSNDVIAGASTDTRTYRAPGAVDATTDEIAAAVSPADRADDGTGRYLQYSDSVVAVQPAAEGGGSVVTLDDDSHARRRFPFIVPIFISRNRGGFGGGGFGGGSGTARGGGPGSGK